jgi:hypothetical protein
MRCPKAGVEWVVAGALLATAACPSHLLSPADTESQVRAHLTATTHLREKLPGGETLELRGLQFSEVVVSVHDSGAEVLTHVEARGEFEGTPLQYLGSERLILTHTGDGFSGDLVPALAGVLQAVAQRQRAIAAEDRTALIALAASDYRDGSVDRERLDSLFPTLWPTVERGSPSAIAVRVDGERAVVSLRFEGDGGSRTHTLGLQNAGKSWRYSAGLL